MQVKVVFRQTQLNVTVEAGSTIGRVIELSGILRQHPTIDLTVQSVGIYNTILSLDYLVAEDDRVEIYELLKIDPKDARRIRAKK